MLTHHTERNVPFPSQWLEPKQQRLQRTAILLSVTFLTQTDLDFSFVCGFILFAILFRDLSNSFVCEILDVMIEMR